MFFPKTLYAVAIFLSSCLLFLAEPMAGKRLLPLLGGSAAVWTTCLVFFQTALLLGYFCAHALATRTRAVAQGIVYTALLALSLVQVWRSVNPDLRATPAHPIVSVLWLLTTLVGLPFLALSATSPLLQAWYARELAASSNKSGQPYRLFALSNFGSMLALIIYPWLVEPNFSLRTQALAWGAGFLLLLLVSALIALRLRNFNISTSSASAAAVLEQEPRPAVGDRTLWLLLAACGSLMLSAMTNHLSQNVAAIPLLWIIPLIAYLLSFIVAFSGDRFRPRWLMSLLLAIALGGIGFILYRAESRLSFKLSILVFCVALFIICLYCHAELHRLRPSPRYATSFYLMIAAGGAIGATFVGVLAPLIFSGNYELYYGLPFAAVLAFVVSWRQHILWRIFWVPGTAAVVWLAVHQIRTDRLDSIAQMRSFYGTLSITQTVREGGYMQRTLYHGTIEHGLQIYSKDLRMWPTSYYAHNSGVGLAMDLCCDKHPRRVGMIGLGTGTLAAYGRKGDVFRFYEINPQVEPIARNVFTYLKESQAHIDIVQGDARLSLADEPPQGYDVLVVDAFSGDAIPVHLLTTQAIELYQRHLQPDGILAIHVSNQFLELAPEVQKQAEHAGLSAVLVISPEDLEKGEYSSDWVLVTKNLRFLAEANVIEAQEPIKMPQEVPLWTDDYNSLLPLLKKEPWIKKEDKDEDQSDEKKDNK
ncbi:MAG: hypothetical protein DMG65_11965 [Candidatus Angelobacter sp. Gp1-AA117]|nr:MAG: hypothetical protein DMG65_11965 [Candidatus Angelobacter sp. Gp1-AA117]